jgi:hypothetical protein
MGEGKVSGKGKGTVVDLGEWEAWVGVLPDPPAGISKNSPSLMNKFLFCLVSLVFVFA